MFLVAGFCEYCYALPTYIKIPDKRLLASEHRLCWVQLKPLYCYYSMALMLKFFPLIAERRTFQGIS